MKQSILLFLALVAGITSRAYGQAPAQTANDYVRPYAEPFQYGINLGYYNSAWSDEKLAGLAQTLNGHSVRPTLPDRFVEQYGYSIRANTFSDYVNKLGMKEITCFVEGPSDAHRDWTIYPGGTEPSKLFAHLYEPIWNWDGTVNANNYYANYLYKLLQTYGDKVRFWEIVNEPDFTNGATMNQWLTRPPTPGETVNLQAPIFHYIRMLRISYEVIKKYHPEAYVTTGGVGYAPFVDALLRYTDNPNGGAVSWEYPNTGGAYLDALSFHSYPAYALHHWDNSISGFRYTRTSDYAALKVMEDKDAMAAVLTKYGYDGTKHPAKQLLMTETNIGRRTADDRTGSDEMQRNFGIKTLILAQKQNIKQLYFFNLGETVNAPAAGQSVSGEDELALMGLYENLTRDLPGAQKTTQLGQAFATTSKLLYGYFYDAPRTAALNLPAGVEGAAFSKNGSYRYVLWAKALVDNVEAASATYSFPAAWNLAGTQRYEWNYATTNAQVAQPAQNLTLSTAPSFFSETPGAVAVAGGNCPGTGSLLREQWDNVSVSTLASMPLNTAPSRSSTLTQFEAQDQYGTNYAARVRGYLCPPVSGAYTFWLAGDDAAELYVSTDADPAHKVRLATCTGWTASSRDWNRYPSQQSVTVTLQAGQRYYIEALHQQTWGAGYLAVAWRRPDGLLQEPIPGNCLLPFTTALATTAGGSPSTPTRTNATTSTKARITFTFATAPASATARIAPTLYDKSRVLQFEEDDSPVSIYTDVFPLLKGGVGPDGHTYPGLRFSDGCGHNRPWTAAVAINGHNSYNNSEWLAPGPTHDASKLVWTQAQELLNQGWDVENHSDLHTADNPAQQLATLDALISTHLQGYKPSVCVVPTNFAGYPTAAFAAGYLGVTSASQSDGLPMFNPYNDNRTPLSSLPAPSVPCVYQRYNADQDVSGGETNNAHLARLKAVSDQLLAPSSGAAEEVYVQRVFSHGLSFANLADWLTYTQSIAQDRLWVTTLREFGEYRRVSSQVVKTETLSGKTLTVDLDYAGLSEDTRFQNLTLLLDSPGTLVNISVSGADSSSVNVATKLVNVFRHQGPESPGVLTSGSASKTSVAELKVFPNPFSQKATVEFTVKKSGLTSMALYDLKGQLVRQLYAGPATAGTPRRVALPGLGLSAGLYVVRLVTGTEVVNQKLSYLGE